MQKLKGVRWNRLCSVQRCGRSWCPNWKVKPGDSRVGWGKLCCVTISPARGRKGWKLASRLALCRNALIDDWLVASSQITVPSQDSLQLIDIHHWNIKLPQLRYISEYQSQLDFPMWPADAFPEIAMWLADPGSQSPLLFLLLLPYTPLSSLVSNELPNKLPAHSSSLLALWENQTLELFRPVGPVYIPGWNREKFWSLYTFARSDVSLCHPNHSHSCILRVHCGLNLHWICIFLMTNDAEL